MDSKQEREETNIGSTASAFLNLRSNHRLALRATKCGLGLRALGMLIESSMIFGMCACAHETTYILYRPE